MEHFLCIFLQIIKMIFTLREFFFFFFKNYSEMQNPLSEPLFLKVYDHSHKIHSAGRTKGNVQLTQANQTHLVHLPSHKDVTINYLPWWSKGMLFWGEEREHYSLPPPQHNHMCIDTLLTPTQSYNAYCLSYWKKKNAAEMTFPRNTKVRSTGS